MLTKIVKGERISRALWKALDPMARLVMLARGQVSIDDEGLPVIGDEVTGIVIRDVEVALGLRAA